MFLFLGRSPICVLWSGRKGRREKGLYFGDEGLGGREKKECGVGGREKRERNWEFVSKFRSSRILFCFCISLYSKIKAVE